MLPKILLTLALFASTTISAQEPIKLEKTVFCLNTEQVLNNILNKHKELPLWGATLTNSNVAIFVNPQTKTWTLLQWNENLACVVDMGTGYLLNLPGKGV